jgi:prephenate dehydrogenase
MPEPRFLPVVPDPGREGSHPGAPPVFERIAIVGVGLIGGSIALAARKAWPTALVIGVDRREVLEQAMVAHAVDVASADPMIISEADLVVLAAPIGEILRMIPGLPGQVEGEAVVTDVASTKRQVVEAAAVLPRRLPFVGGHPLAGMPRSGFAHARPDLFAGRPWLFTPVSSPDLAAVLPRLAAFVEGLGAEPVTLPTPDAHDQIVAAISALPQLASVALMRAVGESAGDWLHLAGRGLADSTRLAEAPASAWREACETNEDHVRVVLDRLIAELQALRDGLAGGDGVDRAFDAANAWRKRLLSRP